MSPSRMAARKTIVRPSGDQQRVNTAVPRHPRQVALPATVGVHDIELSPVARHERDPPPVG